MRQRSDEPHLLDRVSTRSSLDSLLTSWDFSASLPSSPVRSYPFPSSAALSPSVASQLHEYFAPLATNGHSRSSSRIPSMPPSPRISMRQWAESGLDISKIPRRRTGSDTGGFRSPSKSALRRAESASIDLRRSPDVTVPLRHLSGSRRSPEVRTDLAQEASTPGPKSTHFEAADHRSPPIKSTARDSHGDETVSEADTSFEALNSAPSERSKLIASPLEDVASSITLEDSALAQNSIDLPADGVIPSRPPDKVYKRSDSSYRTSAIMPPDEEVGWLGRRSSVRKDRKVWGTSLVQKLTGKKHRAFPISLRRLIFLADASPIL